jgi:3-polyprenyl-4-hydroxybenzoate decarboxylase
MRSDVMHQTLLHAGRFVGRMDSANLASLNAEVGAWRVLRAARLDPVGINFSLASNGRQHARVALRRGAPGQARLAIAALFSLPTVKHAFIVDEDVDVFSDEEMEWAMAVRFRADRDLIVTTDMPGFYADPTADENGRVTKAGFDLTAPTDQPDTIEYRRAYAPAAGAAAPTFKTVVDALNAGPKHFGQIVTAIGSSDGREIALELDTLRERGVLTRLPNGEWALKDQAKDQ